MAIIKKLKEFAPTHKQLVTRIATWYKNSYQSCIVMAELKTVALEIPDVIVWKSGAHSILIECKTSRADFLSDKDKFFRQQESYGMGDERYYAAPTGMIRPEELPQGWGLYEVDEKFVREVRRAEIKHANKRHECIMLMSMLRRLEISTAVFVRHDTPIDIVEERPLEQQGEVE